MHTTTSTGARKLLLLLVVLCTAILTACSGAQINTDLDLKDAQSGSRVMKLTLDKDADNDEYVKGGLPAVEKSIKENLPKDLEFSGVKQEGDKRVGTFTLKFDSIADYQEKAQNLLDAAGSDKKAEINIANNESGLVQGKTVEENFTSKDLLGWIPEALAADGVIDKNNKSSVFGSTGDTTVEFAGEKLKVSSPSSSIKVSNVRDNGFSSVNVIADLREDSKTKGTVLMGSSESLSAAKEKKIQEYFDSALPDGAEVKDLSKDSVDSGSFSSASHGRAVIFDASSMDEFSQKLGKILGSDQVSLKLEEHVSEENPTKVTSSLKGSLNCLAICSPEASRPQLEALVPDNWNVNTGSSKASDGYVSAGTHSALATDTPFSIDFEYAIPLQTAEMVTDLKLGGGAKTTFTYTAFTGDVERAGDGFRALLDPGDNGEFEQSDKDGVTTFKATIEGSDPEDYTSKVSQYIPGASLDVTKDKGFSLWPRYGVNLNLPISQSKLDGGVNGGFAQGLNLPAMNKFVDEQPPSASTDFKIDGKSAVFTQDTYSPETGESISLIAKGPGIGSLIILGILGLLLLAPACCSCCPLFLPRKDFLSRQAGMGKTRAVRGAGAERYLSRDVVGAGSHQPGGFQRERGIRRRSECWWGFHPTGREHFAGSVICGRYGCATRS